MVRRAVIVALAVLMLVPAVAVAMKPLRKQEPDRVPSAQLQAAGSGMIQVVGRMTVWGQITGKGSIEVRDRAGDATMNVNGTVQRFTRARVRVARVKGVTGFVLIKASNARVRIVGDGLDFSIPGVGLARLTGTGQYALNGSEPADWTGDWIRLVPPPSSDARRFGRCDECSSSAVRLR